MNQTLLYQVETFKFIYEYWVEYQLRDEEGSRWVNFEKTFFERGC